MRKHIYNRPHSSMSAISFSRARPSTRFFREPTRLHDWISSCTNRNQGLISQLPATTHYKIKTPRVPARRKRVMIHKALARLIGGLLLGCSSTTWGRIHDWDVEWEREEIAHAHNKMTLSGRCRLWIIFGRYLKYRAMKWARYYWNKRRWLEV